MLEKSIHTTYYFLAAVFFIVVGFFSIFASETLLKYVLLMISFGMFFNALIRFLFQVCKKQYPHLISRTFTDLFFSIFLYWNMDLVSNWLIIFFGLYLFFYALLYLVHFIIYEKNRVHGRLRVFLEFLVVFILSICLVTQPYQNRKYAGIVIGIYLIFYGLMTFFDFLSEVVPKKYSNRFKSKIRIPLPILFTFLIPQKLIDMINDSLDVKQDPSILYSAKEKEDTDFSVLIHLARSGSASFGHVELAYQGKIYSYANYDRHSRFLFDGLGDGVILVADKDSYIHYQTHTKNRYLVEFGLRLTKSQREKVEFRLDRLIHDNTILYHSDQELSDIGEIEKGEFHDMSSDLYRVANAKFYKIVSGKNKTFFVLKTNCAVVAESVLRSLGTFIPENGILAPGSYYEYLNYEFKKKNSNVISRKIYTARTEKVDFN